jgi:hypothetical protein
VGCDENALNGAEEGSCDGTADGFAVGAVDGSPVGDPGAVDGTADGTADGLIDTDVLGAADGITLGKKDDDWLTYVLVYVVVGVASKLQLTIVHARPRVDTLGLMLVLYDGGTEIVLLGEPYVQNFTVK